MKALQLPFFRYSLVILAAFAAGALLFPGVLRQAVSSGPFLPHATCYLQNPGIIWLHVVSDTAIGLAYVSISCTLAYLIYKASEHIPFNWVFLAFGLFIVACGFTHFMEVWTVWQPRYWLAGYVKVVTALASVFTAVALFPLIPRIFRMIESLKASEERKRQLAETHSNLQAAHQVLAARQAELEEANRQLAARTVALEEANEELEMFTYSVAHDVRAPLRAIQGFANVLEEEYASGLGEGADYLKRILTSSDKLDHLVTDLLAYSKVSRGLVELRPVRVADGITEALELVAPQNHPRHPKVVVPETAAQVVANSTLLGQVLVNLLSNAIKYVPKDAVPQVTIAVEQQQARVRISVHDNGIGISEQNQSKIFRMFERVNPSPDYPGTGIGLAIVKRAVERMGGQVGLQSSPGKGSTFWFELPEA